MTAGQLLRAVKQAGFEVIREYRTHDEVPVPEDLKEIYTEDVLRPISCISGPACVACMVPLRSHNHAAVAVEFEFCTHGSR